VAADAVGLLVGAHHHRHGVPAHQRADALLEREVAGVLGLLVGGMVLT
jgi:hypothetical protein